MRWMRPVVAIAAVSGMALTFGVAQASAAAPAQPFAAAPSQPSPSAPGSAQSAPASCVAGGYRAQAKVAYRRTADDTVINSISVNVDKRAGAHNKVRIVVKDEDKTVFYYASQPTVTAGPFLFDYTDSPIPTHQQSPSDRLTVEVTFDFDRGTGGSAAAPESASPDDAAQNDQDGSEGHSDDQEGQSDNGDEVGDPGTSGNRKHHKHSDADPAFFETPALTSPQTSTPASEETPRQTPGQSAAPVRCTASVRF